jgi:nickel/cobalt exporter
MKLGIFFCSACLLIAHPLGNFSVSHYTRLDVSASGVTVSYVLDLAEIPTYELLRDWKLNAKSPQAALDSKAVEQSRQWMSGLDFRAGGQRVEPKLVRASIRLTDATGGLNTARVTSVMTFERGSGRLDFEDHNYPERAGWKEIVIDPGEGTEIVKASQGDSDRSRMLAEYPPNAIAAAPQDLRASVEWRAGKGIAKIAPIEQPAPVQGPAAPVTAASSPARSDYLSTLLGKKDIGLGLMLLGMAVAFGLGAMHAMTPGHGKTIVAAYLVGSRGTMGQAAFLGAMVTFTHTISVFALGLVTLFLSRYVVPEKIIPVLGAISGLAIVAVGGSLFVQRLRRLRHQHAHDHNHHHHHNHDHPHTHEHTHVPEGDVTLTSLIALGASGGLVPCPSALVLLLTSIALGHVGLGLILLVAFSLGLAGVLMATGMMVLYAKHWLPDPVAASRHPLFRLVPVLSAVVIVCLGLVMTWVSVA